MHEHIINRGRGPEIAGSRITVYDILDYHNLGWDHGRIAAFFRLSSDQVTAALNYIAQNSGTVLASYQQILERSARGNPPELQARLDATHAKYQSLWKDQGRLTPAGNNGDERHPGGQ